MSTLKKDRDFCDVLTDLDDGAVHQQATDELGSLIRAALDTNKGGSMTITLTAKPDRKGMVCVTSKIATRLPAPSTNATMFFTDDVGNVHRNDPRQLPLKAVAPTPIKGGN